LLKKVTPSKLEWFSNKDGQNFQRLTDDSTGFVIEMLTAGALFPHDLSPPLLFLARNAANCVGITDSAISLFFELYRSLGFAVRMPKIPSTSQKPHEILDMQCRVEFAINRSTSAAVADAAATLVTSLIRNTNVLNPIKSALIDGSKLLLPLFLSGILELLATLKVPVSPKIESVVQNSNINLGNN
jgi:hypothetical protein